MSWITVIWSLTAGVSFTFAAVHFLVWLRDREALANLLFSVSAVAATAIAMQELNLMRAQTPAEFGAILRWMHVSVAVLMVSLVWFIRSYLGTGRLWLAWLITSLRGLVLVINFSFFPNATFQEIHALREVFFLGETLSAPVGDPNPWRFLIHLSMVLFLIYAVDAAVSARKLGSGRQALVLGVSVLLAIILAAIFSGLMVRGVIPGPLTTMVFMTLVLAMAVELSVDLIRAKDLAGRLKVNEERMRLTAQATGLGLWDWDIAQDKVWINDVGRDRHETPAPEPASQEHYLRRVHPDDRDRLQQAVKQTIVGQKDFYAEFRMPDSGGIERWIAASGKVERDAAGQPLRLHGISMDITDRKRTEEELQRHRSALAHSQRVSAMGQLSAALAHELSQPLGAILRNAEAGELFLRKDPPDLSELRGILVDIQRDDRRAADVIDRWRMLLRHEELRFETIVVRELVDQVSVLLGAEMHSHGVVLRTVIPVDLPGVRGDSIHLQQVLVNLLLNSLEAVDARETGPREIEISANRVDGGLIEMSVKDTGRGIDPDRISQVFEPFFTTKAKDKSMGMGLAISKTIIEAHGGSIRAANNPDGGACISFTLPIVQPGDRE